MPDPHLFWEFPPEDHAAYVAAGCGTESMEQYRDSLAREKAYAKEMGRKIVVLRLTVKEMIAELQRLSLPCTPAGVSIAMRSIFERQTRADLSLSG